MIERTINPTSSIGPAWPPEKTSNMRMRGFYHSVVKAPGDIDAFVNNFEHYQAYVTAHSEIDRLSIRAVASLGAISAFASFGIGMEGAMPVRGEDGLFIVYTAWNDPVRKSSEEILIKHRRFLSATASESSDTRDDIVHLATQGFIPKMINESTSESNKLAMAERFTELYGTFGYTQSEVEDLLLNPANTIAYIENNEGVVSTAMAEKAVVTIEGHGDIRMAEITEAFTLPSYRQRGLYKSISGYLIDKLHSESNDPLDVIYGESNLAMAGVVIAAHQNGRHFSYLDRERLGIMQPDFGILQQSFHVEDGVETRRFNDFALSYVPLS